MCGIVGLFLKSTELEPDLGRLTGLMLEEMRERGPDSTGFAVYSDAEPEAKLVLLDTTDEADWPGLAARLATALGVDTRIEALADHAVLHVAGDGDAARRWLIDNAPGARVLSLGHSIEVFKGLGTPAEVAARFRLASRGGSHALAHTRMATESAVTTAGSHPFATGADSCLVHNGSLSNHNRLRRSLMAAGERFQTDNDSEVAAGYLAARLRAGADLDTALHAALRDLDGFYTFAIGSATGFAVLRDPIACKPAVIAETDAWVAMASEYRAIATLPDAGHAELWEPQPGRVYSWGRAA